MKQRIFFLITAAVFSTVAALHVLRLVYGWNGILGEVTIPLWASWLAMFLSGYLAFYAWRFWSRN